MMRVIRPQMRGPMEGALVEERGIVFTLPVELPPEGAGVILDRIERLARKMERTRSGLNNQSCARALQSDLARLRELL